MSRSSKQFASSENRRFQFFKRSQLFIRVRNKRFPSSPVCDARQ
jgi:hypothetical protein